MNPIPPNVAGFLFRPGVQSLRASVARRFYVAEKMSPMRGYIKETSMW
jgi:hypothetical protein